MNYPIWQLDFAGGGLLIALIATIHVYISHFAVGGGLFLVLTEHKGLRENNPAIIDYVKRHTRFFILITMVLGALTGVGIWFTISVLSPGATSKLIHLFLFAWAIEWLFFFIEVLSLVLYYQSFGKINNRNHLTLGWIYFGSAIMSLFFINGIIGFMLTPGEWVNTGNFWQALFNPTFWPSFFFRSFLAIIIAGLFGFLTATAIKEEELRHTLVSFCAKWLLIPFVLFLASAWWYSNALPLNLRELIFDNMPETKTYIYTFVLCSPLIIIGGIIMAIRLPAKITRPLAAFMLVIGLIYIGSFEFLREGGRRPYIIRNYMYSNSILKKDLAQVKQSGVLAAARWAENRTITADNQLAAGREVFYTLCSSCHSVGGPFNDIKNRISRYAPQERASIFANMGSVFPFMPPFTGNEDEKKALLHFLSQL